jgi:hypothetical protein
MRLGLIVDSGVLHGLAKEHAPHAPLADHLKREGTRLVTIREVMAECIDVPMAVLQHLNILVEPTRTPSGSQTLLDAFSSGPRTVPWSVDPLPRADRAVVGHAIAARYDIVTTDGAMKDRSFREFLRRLERLPDTRLPAWYIPKIVILRRPLVH